MDLGAGVMKGFISSMVGFLGLRGRGRQEQVDSRHIRKAALISGSPLALALEPRFMFDGAAVATAADVAQPHDTPDAQTSDATDHAAPNEGAEAAESQAPMETSAALAGQEAPAVESQNGPDPAAFGADQTSDAGPEAAAALAEPTYQVLREADPSQTGGRREVAFIDTSVADYQTLVDGVRPGVEVVLLDGAGDGLAQMAAWAEGKSGYDAIHVLSHGNQGSVQLGILSLDTAAVAGRTAELAAVGAALATDGDLLLYGCQVAGADGNAFLLALAEVTQADIALSTDTTGPLSLGADWDIERTHGTITASVPLSIGAQESFGTLLTAPLKDVTMSFGSSNQAQVSTATINASLTNVYADGSANSVRSGLNLTTDTTIGILINFNANNVTTAGVGGSGDAALFIGATGTSLNSATFTSNDGSAFKLNSFVFAFDVFNSTTDTRNVTISAAKVGGGTATVTNNLVEQTAHTVNLSSNTDFQNITSFTISYSSTLVRMEIDDILLANAVTSGDTTAPTLNGAGSTPANNATSVAVSSDIVVDFSESVQFGSSGTITVRNVTTGADAGTFTVSSGNASGAFGTATISSDKLTINPTNNLASGTQYSVRFTAGSIQDTATTPNDLAVIDNDEAYNFITAAGTVTLSINNATAGESAGTDAATVTATLSAAASVDTTVTLTPSGTATGSGTDYTLGSTTITITAGNTTGTTTISLNNDSLDEADETVILDITGVSGGGGATESGTPQQVTLTITDDDATPSLSIANASLTEGNSGSSNMTFTVTLDAASGRAVTVDYGTTGSGGDTA